MDVLSPHHDEENHIPRQKVEATIFMSISSILNFSILLHVLLVVLGAGSSTSIVQQHVFSISQLLRTIPPLLSGEQLATSRYICGEMHLWGHLVHHWI